VQVATVTSTMATALQKH